MRILLDTTIARRGPGGTAVYLSGLVPALRALGVEVSEVANVRRPPPAGGGLGSVRNLALDRCWTAVELPRRARATGAQLIHHPLPALAGRRAPCPEVVTVHDLAFERLPGGFDPAFRAVARRRHRNAARGAAAVICVSETTAADARARWGVSARRIVVAPHGPGQALDTTHARVDRDGGPFLYVGDAEPRKNLVTLLAAHRLYRERAGEKARELVLAGAVPPEAAATPGVRVEPRPDAERLGWLYAGAVALVHPALHEGFGLTPLEAMSAGTPVLAGRAPGVVETCADAALYADPRDPRSFAEAMAELDRDPALRRGLAERGRRRATEFSWESCARAHLEAYALALR